MVKKFNAAKVTLTDLNLIEASAGTGKTYTLAELYCRLLLERDLTVDQVLVVTYTRAATEELRERLRQKLVDARDGLLVKEEQVSPACQKLNLAIQSFDEAAIFTIHGFCQRVLSDFAFESGLAFDVALVGDDQALLQSAVDDFWRRHITTADHTLVRYLLAKGESPDRLLQSIRPLLGKPYCHYLPIPELDAAQYYQQAQTQFEKLKVLWATEHEAVIATLQNKTLLNGNMYRTTSVERWLLSLTELLSQENVPLTFFADFDRFTPIRLQAAIKGDQPLPKLQFWLASEQFLDVINQLKTAQAVQYQQLRYQLLQELHSTVKKQKQQQQLQSYDDLLLNLQQALDGEGGDWLVKRLRQQYPAALIDEFQDTDPVQYASFSRIYVDSGLPVFLVGDPKQAIYSFRGADIFTYLAAKSSVQTQYTHTLDTNWRSHPDLVQAVNNLWKRQVNPFLYESIPFVAVKAARKKQQVLATGGAHNALQFLWADSAKPLTKQDMTARASAVTADEIARLLNQADTGDATLLDDKSQQVTAVSGGDIAVLVRNHRQAHAIQQCLQQRSINSVQQGRDNVFASREALMLSRVLQAMAEPQNPQRITSALATDLWGLSAIELDALQQDEPQWANQLDLFYELHQLWLKYGFIRAFRHLLNTISGQQQLLSLPDGERKLTNLLHLSELIQAQCHQHHAGIETVLQWFKTRMQSIDPNDETGQLRLESDEQLVKIITIHKSKGLEYPIVFCPFLWDSNLRSANQDVISFHAPNDHYRTHVAFSEPALSQAAEAITIEERAEDLRLLYVALTRARERCVICWGHVKAAKDSALFSLLHPDTDALDNDKMLTDLMQLAALSEGTITVSHLDETATVVYQGQDKPQDLLSARVFEGFIHQPWRIGSFSALTQGHDQDAEMPDYDAQAANEAGANLELNTTARDRFSFPRGAQAGTCLHAIFEVLDFASGDNTAIQALVNRTLLQYGFDEQWTAIVCQWLSEVLMTPLEQHVDDRPVRLADLSQGQRLDELAFYFPVAGLTVRRLQKALLPLIAAESPLATVVSQLSFSSLTGFMKGFIDLVFEHQGRFYIVDYKSNWLGDSEVAYQPVSLEQAMISHDYPLQYLIYSLALHRYLKLRLPAYEPELHLGGSYYLFIRGMKPEWQQSGVFFDRPSVDVLDALDRCLQGVLDD